MGLSFHTIDNVVLRLLEHIFSGLDPHRLFSGYPMRNFMPFHLTKWGA